MKKLSIRLVGVGLLALVLTGCGNAPDHPSLRDAELPPLIAVRDFVANTDDNGGYRVSPDGNRLTWVGVSRLRSAIRWRSLKPGSRIYSKRFKKNAPRPMWAADGHTILYHEDASGREQSHVFAINTLQPDAPARDLTPYAGVTAFVVQVPAEPTSRVHVVHNRRDKAVFDLYAVDVATGVETLLAKNTESVLHQMVDDDGSVRARVRQDDSARYLEVPDGEGWRALRTATRFDSIWPVGLDASGEGLYLVSNIGRDKSVLSKLVLATAEETVLFEHAQADVTGVAISARDRRPLVVYADPSIPDAHYFDKALEQRLAAIELSPGARIDITSVGRAERFATAVAYDEKGSQFHLLDLDAGTSEVIGESSSRKHATAFARTKPISFEARDGMLIHGYLTVPRVAKPMALPTVLLVHGGPLWRDRWHYSDRVQFLANRGYVVLQVNYRGSTGFGRAYTDAAIGEFGRAMHNDLIDAVRWAASEGVADPDRVAIMGRSFGGYATLVGMTMTPGEFVCGIDIVGVSDLATLYDDAPPHWRSGQHWWHRFAGDPATAEGAALLRERSPINFAAQMRGPLLVIHGRNDPRVNVSQSDRMVAALRAAGKTVDYEVIEGEGHRFDHWKHQMTIHRMTEDFLHECLGGRSGGFDFYQLGSWAF